MHPKINSHVRILKMANTTFTGPVISTNGFVGDVTGDITGDVAGNVTQPVAAVTAAGTNLATAAALSAGVNVVAGADGTKGVALPAALAGATITIYSSVATNGLVVYSQTAETVNGGASVTMEGQTFLQAIATADGAWITTIFTADT
jgi:hypothetical protein